MLVYVRLNSINGSVLYFCNMHKQVYTVILLQTSV